MPGRERRRQIHSSKSWRGVVAPTKHHEAGRARVNRLAGRRQPGRRRRVRVSLIPELSVAINIVISRPARSASA